MISPEAFWKYNFGSKGMVKGKELISVLFREYPFANSSRVTYFRMLKQALPLRDGGIIRRPDFEKFATLFGPVERMVENCFRELFDEEGKLVRLFSFA